MTPWNANYNYLMVGTLLKVLDLISLITAIVKF